jgi:hypothetical protein
VSDEIQCKRIIDGRTYNTETATLLGQWQLDNAPLVEALFKTRYGAYFLYNCRDDIPHTWIKPLEEGAARKWLEDCCPGDTATWEREFGEAPEAGDPEARVTLRIPETLRKRVAVLAEERQQSLNAWIQRCLERCAGTIEQERS